MRITSTLVMWSAQRSCPEARWTVCWAGRLSRGILCLIRSLASWCRGWSAGNVGEPVPNPSRYTEPASLQPSFMVHEPAFYVVKTAHTKASTWPSLPPSTWPPIFFLIYLYVSAIVVLSTSVHVHSSNCVYFTAFQIHRVQENPFVWRCVHNRH